MSADSDLYSWSLTLPPLFLELYASYTYLSSLWIKPNFSPQKDLSQPAVSEVFSHCSEPRSVQLDFHVVYVHISAVFHTQKCSCSLWTFLPQICPRAHQCEFVSQLNRLPFTLGFLSVSLTTVGWWMLRVSSLRPLLTLAIYPSLGPTVTWKPVLLILTLIMWFFFLRSKIILVTFQYHSTVRKRLTDDRNSQV